MDKNTEKNLNKHFKDHKATFTDLGNIKILDFKKPGSNEYRVRFLFEEDYYKLHITGDLGSLTATNDSNMTYEGFSQYVNNPRYFMEKVNCHDRPFYEYDPKKARKDVVQFIKDFDLTEQCVEDYNENNFHELKGAALQNAAVSEKTDEILEDFDYRTGIGRIGWMALEEMYSDAFEYISDFGKKDTDIIETYLYAFKLAKEQIGYIPDIKEITLLSVDEYKAARDKISILNDYWWLRSPGNGDIEAACVFGAYGDVFENGYFVFDELGVRPALKISNLESSNLRIGDKIEVAGCMWTIISGKLALCDDFIGRQPFREDWEADDAYDYEASDVKKYLEDWWQKASK